MRSFSPAQCGHVFLPVHLASKTGGVRLTTFSIAKSRKPIKNCSTGPSLLFFGRKIKVALVGIPALLGMPIFSWSRYAPVFEVEPLVAARVSTSAHCSFFDMGGRPDGEPIRQQLNKKEGRFKSRPFFE